MQVSKNFHLREFGCNDGTNVPYDLIGNVRELASRLQIIRDYLGVPIFISSGYRTLNYNQRVGGAKKSQHLTASAADIYSPYLSSTDIFKAILDLEKKDMLKVGGLSLYPTFVHFDIRKKRLIF